VRTVPGRIAAALLTLACLGLDPAQAQASRFDDAAARTVVAQAPEPAADEGADAASAVRPGPARRMAFDLGLEPSPLHGLAKGHLLRAQLNAHSHLTLRLRGGRVGLYLAVRFTGAE
jgi:hypothetical protein